MITLGGAGRGPAMVAVAVNAICYHPAIGYHPMILPTWISDQDIPACGKARLSPTTATASYQPAHPNPMSELQV